MISRASTMNPTIPPPVPYCHASAWIVKVGSFLRGAAEVRAARQRVSRRLNMLSVALVRIVNVDQVERRGV